MFKNIYKIKKLFSLNLSNFTVYNFIILGACFFVVLIFSSFEKINASSGDQDVFGYAWSDNIGWISLNSGDWAGNTVDYGVIIDASGDFSGYAWSDNLGWIDFGPTSGYPESPNRGARLSGNGEVDGWIKVLSGDDDIDGWDGWIKMRGSGYGVDFDSGTNSFDGFAWGSDVVGWIDFDLMNLAVCGDGVCGSIESIATCPSDCIICGDLICSTGETEATCADCTPVCGNGICGIGESVSCPADCNYTCPNGICETNRGENFINCPTDCSFEYREI